MQDTNPSPNPGLAVLQASLSLVDEEIRRVLGEVDLAELQRAASQLLTAKRVFLAGAGRSGLALRMTAMRLMHLGLQAHVAGDTTTPAMEAGDVLLLASASGTTASMVHLGEVAHKLGAPVILLTTAPESRLATLAQATVFIPAATKADEGERSSGQYAGSLFEQAVLLVMDALFHALWKSGGQSAQQLLRRHANLE